MRQDIINTYQGEAGIFKALSHPTRLFILHTLKEQTCSVSELAEMAEIDISTMSKHLDLLKRYNIVNAKKHRNTVYYQLTIPCLFDFMQCAQKILHCPADCKNNTPCPKPDM